ncbi:ATP-dependent DNA helicase RecG [Kineococcus radiotolerans]|uniref:Probable DNA 3'-5' helicase RecG n=1 Tax=Kineococcus radiotolerans TaxID=131568 RepID=A0A7W4TJB1_KINRA|nr:ATP-dependent DNA helicase RecG [Kineococcus radiotolerans]MBB2899945.1 ATP-dependent DNA helicase RecG [Kineococcus radiotolerans]
MDELDAPLSSRLPRGKGNSKKANPAKFLSEGLGLETVRDLLWHLPRRYADRGTLTPIRDLVEGENATILAQVVKYGEPQRMRAKDGVRLVVTLGDGRDTLTMTFFAKFAGQFAHQKADLVPGALVLASGKVSKFQDVWQLSHPDYETLEDPEDGVDAVNRPIPLYPASKAAPNWLVRQSVAQLLDGLEGQLPEFLPAEVVAGADLLDPLAALRAVHAPRDEAELEAGRHRLRYEEAFVLQTALALRRASTARQRAVARTASPDGIAAAFDQRLPFPLTGSQRAVGEEIAADLARPHPMQRLLQGDVGSGKTLVALRAMLTVVDGGGQAALLAPTEVLAAQHLRSITAMLGDLAGAGTFGAHERATKVVLLTGSMGAPARRAALLAAASGEAGIVIGTHALLQEHVQFADLGFVVVDEQHRFGVEQRDALRAKGNGIPHLLVMTATPIPRTVAMTLFGDLETSVLTELPPGRADVQTVVVPQDRPAWIDRTWQRIAEEAALGRQSYVVCARIDTDDEGGEDGTPPGEGPEEEPAPDDALFEEPRPRGGKPGRPKPRPAAAVSQVVEVVRTHPATAGLRTEVLHGRLPPAEKDDVMSRFAAGEVDVVVATTVVEVGVDVPNASVMVVVDADRFGISQLHQLRGRIGRGGLPGTCLLLSGASEGSPAGQRLAALARTRDGFELARLDLEQRREGDVLGAAQSGERSSLQLLGVLRDAELVAHARAAAVTLVAADPDLSAHRPLAAAVAARVSGDTEAFLERA